MLIEFSVENFRSIKDRVTLSMIAASKKDNLEENLIKTDFKDLSLLKSAVIYGPNASGKSNVIRAMWTMWSIIRNSNKIQKDEELSLTPFLLDMEHQNKPSSFEVLFIQEGIRYIYGFSAGSKKIYTEYLYYYPSGKKAIIFERRETTNFRFTKDVREQKELSARTADNALYLSTATQWNYKRIAKVFDWFRELIIINPSAHIARFTANLVFEDDEAKKFVGNFLRNADTGVQGINVDKKKIKNIEDFSIFSSAVKKTIEELHAKTGEISLLTAQSIHYPNDNIETPVVFEFKEESDGTKKLFELLGVWYDALKNGKILFVDELSVRLHPYLVEFLIKIFNSDEYNQKGAQLIFTTHNTYLLKQSLFRKDQIWFTEKTPQQSTDLYSLYDIKGLRDENIEKGYLLGRYGAIPIIDWVE